MNKAVKYRALVWLVSLIFLSLATLYLARGTSLNASVLAMLPQDKLSTLPPEIEDGFIKRLDKQIIFLIGDKDLDSHTVSSFIKELEKSKLFSTVDGRLDPDFMSEYGKFLFAYKNAFIDESTRLQLSAEGARSDYVLQNLFSAFMGVSTNELVNDPLLLIRSYQENLLKHHQSKLELQNGFLCVKNQEKTYYFIRAELSGEGFSITDTKYAVDKINSIKAKFEEQGLEILNRGTAFYSYEATKLAQNDIQILGTSTIVLVFLLIFLAYKTLLPVVLVVISCIGGAICASFITLLIFPNLHLMTLVLSLSIVGISVDYSLYYLSARMQSPSSETPLETLNKVKRPLILALISTLCAYFALCITPFPIIRQMAIFAIAGLIGAFLTVYFLHPYFALNLKRRPLPLQNLFKFYFKLYSSKKRALTIFMILIVTSALGLSQLNYQDDISAFQKLPLHLVTQDQKIATLTSQSAEQKWLALYSSNQDELLVKLEKVRDSLNKAQDLSLIKGYQALPLNSQTTQTSDLKLLEKNLINLDTTLKAQGFNLELKPYSQNLLSLNDYLKSPLSHGFKLLYLEKDGTFATLIGLNEIKDLEKVFKLVKEHEPSVILIDRKASFDELFYSLRETILSMLSFALLAVLLLFMIKQGIKDGLRLALPCLLSEALALAIPCLLGFTLNFFNVLALIPVLGMGINYALFFKNQQSKVQTAAFSVTLAMLTTLLTLGILIFSNTQAIAAFGLSLSSGLATAFLLAPSVRTRAHHE